jgi:hypothetical protein
VLDDSNIEMSIFNTNKPLLHPQAPNHYLTLDLKISTSLKNFSPPTNFTPIFEKLVNFWVTKQNSSLQKIFSDFFPPETQDQIFSSFPNKDGKNSFFLTKNQISLREFG